MDRLTRDLRHAARMLIKTPVFTSVVVFTLAVGIGANTAMFSVVNGVLLQGLPFKHADRIVDINEVERRDIGGGGAIARDILDWRKMATSHDVMSVHATRTSNVTPTTGEPARVRDRELVDVLRCWASPPWAGRSSEDGEPAAITDAQLRFLAGCSPANPTSSMKRCGSMASPTRSSA
jgi:putative ABC transport system permease protein